MTSNGYCKLCDGEPLNATGFCAKHLRLMERSAGDGSLERVVRALAESWERIADDLALEQPQQMQVMKQIRAREIQVCRWHSKQLRAEIRKCSNGRVTRRDNQI